MGVSRRGCFALLALWKRRGGLRVLMSPENARPAGNVPGGDVREFGVSRIWGLAGGGPVNRISFPRFAGGGGR